MSCEGDTGDLLRRTGRRSTQQRRRIATALRHAGGHLEARAIWELVDGQAPAPGEAPISPSTVYRALETFRSMRLVSAVEDAAGRTTYAWVTEHDPHLHLVCRVCGDSAEAAGDLLDGLTAAIEEVTGFEPFLDHLAVMGRCTDCRDVEAEPLSSPAGTGHAGTGHAGTGQPSTGQPNTGQPSTGAPRPARSGATREGVA